MTTAGGVATATDLVASGDLAGRVALITGGTGGVGLHTAEMFARRGATVAVNGRSEGGGKRALDSLAAVTKEAVFVAGDLTEYASVQRVVGAIVARFGGIDILVSAGAEGAVGPKPFAEMSGAEIEDAFRTRFLPRVFPVHAALPAMRGRPDAAVVMLTTDAARHPTPGESIVGAAGAAVILLTKALGREFARYGVRVNSVAMTITSDTPSWERIFSQQSFSSALFEKAVQRFPSGKPPSAAEVAEVVAFLASPASGQVTGQTVSVNGGLSFGGW